MSVCLRARQDLSTGAGGMKMKWEGHADKLLESGHRRVSWRHGLWCVVCYCRLMRCPLCLLSSDLCLVIRIDCSRKCSVLFPGLR